MEYTALYRKFRPEHFNDVKGQDHIVTTLQNQIQANRIGHAYLFCGTRGTGKTSIAKLFAKTINCENLVEDNPCGVCSSCKAIKANASLNVFEIDAASNNGVDNIREIVEEVSFTPAQGKYKVYIVDEVHMLSTGAFNALLKTLEEPPSYAVFILATTEVHKIPVTILSRCQRYDFKRISVSTITDRLRELIEKEGIEVEEKALNYIAKSADGAMRDALSLLDQCIAFHLGETLTYEMVLEILGAVDTVTFAKMLEHLVKREPLECIKLLEELIINGRELSQFILEFIQYLRNLLLLKTSDNMMEAIDMSRENLEMLKRAGETLDMEEIIRYIRIFSELLSQIKYSANKRILIEVAFIKICKPEMEDHKDTLLARIKQLEQKIEEGVIVSNKNEVGSSTKNEEKRPAITTMQEAVSEEVASVVKNWAAIVESFSMPLKQYVKETGVSQIHQNQLLLIVKDGLASEAILGNEKNKEKIQEVISSFINRSIKINYELIKSDEGLYEKHPDISSVIRYEIEYEE